MVHQTPPAEQPLVVYYRVKDTKTYPWPCQDLPHRTVTLYRTDALVKLPDGTVAKISGLYMKHIHAKMEDLEVYPDPATDQPGSL